MRKALAGLTLRGRCLTAAGVASLACALALGERDLLRVGIFLLALPLAAVVVVARTRYRLTCARSVEPARIPAGHSARVRLRVRNASRMPTGLLLIEDSLPYLLGARPRFVLERLEPRGTRDLDYEVRSDWRGRFRLGPLTVRLADPFGLVELARSFSAADRLVVTPKVFPLPTVTLAGSTTGDGQTRAAIMAAPGEDDVATREYRHGDDLRRVHWRSSAHYGELLVRREEQHQQSRCTLLLDTRSAAHRGDAPESSFEWSVSAAASIGVHLARERFELGFVTDTGQAVTGFRAGTSGSVGSVEGPLLDALAAVTASRNRSLREAAAALHRGGEHDAHAVVVAVLGAMDPDEAAYLARVPAFGAARVAVLVDSASWAFLSAAGRQRADANADRAARLLTRAGWQVAPARYGDRVDRTWPLLQGRTAGRAAAAASGGVR